MKRLVFATNNAHKLEEARGIMSGEPVELVSLRDIDCREDIPETSATLEGNALQKARYVHERYGVACVADDTGLMVDALGGAPGVYSARYAGPGHDSKANMAKLLRDMQGVADRSARFSTVMAYVDDERELTFEGSVEGVIAETPQGDGGFGYDPIFVPRETGVSFALMAPEDKNAISHRGRALRKFAEWFRTLCLILLVMAGGSAAANAEQWRWHHTFDGSVDRIIDTPDLTYFLTLGQEYNPDVAEAAVKYGSLLCYDKKNDEWRWLDKTTGLSETTVVEAEYDWKHRCLVVAYDNGNIDLLKDNGEKTNIPGLMMASGNMSTTVTGISVDENGLVWVATATGFVSIDAGKGEVISSRNYGRKVNGVGALHGRILVATDDGVYYGDPLSGNLDTFTKIEGSGNASRFFTWANYICYLSNVSGINEIYQVDDLSTHLTATPCSEGMDVYYVERGRDGFLFTGNQGVRWYGDDGTRRRWGNPVVYRPQAGSADGKSAWFACSRTGFSRFSTPEADWGQWTCTLKDYIPNASNAFICTSMAYSPKYGMLVRNHGTDRSFGGYQLWTPDLISSLKDGEWKPRSTVYSDDDPDNALLVYNPIGLAIDPKNEDQVYCGSLLSGMLRLDLSDMKKSLHMSKTTEYTGNSSQFVGTDEPAQGWATQMYLSEPVFDSYGILWTTYQNFDVAKAEIRYWMPDDRAASTSKSTFRPMGRLKYSDVPSTNQSMICAMTSSGRRNYLIFDGGNYHSALMVIDHNGTPGDKSDDRRVVESSFRDQDGHDFSRGKTSQIWEDKETGRVWIVSSSGVYHFNPVDFLNGKTTMRRVKVPRNDGTNLADYLLDEIYVNCITSDPAGRKWFGTGGAGIVITSADGTEIMKTYTVENSGIADNSVYGLCYNPSTSSMMVSTGKGLCEVFLEGTGASGDDDAVRAYPNPVRPGYAGMVTIDGLEYDATVKITDAGGNTVKDLGRASGGQVQWDLSNNNYKRVPAGVYLVLATNGPDKDKYAKKTKILVVE